MKALRAVEHVMVAVAPRARRQARGIRAGARLGQAVAGEMLHGAELGQKFLARCVAAEGVDHPGRHVVDRDIGGGRGAALRQLLEDERGVEPRQRRAADVVLDVDAAEAERRRLAQGSRPEKSRSSSQSRACGIISSRANCRAVAWKARCSSVRSKSMVLCLRLAIRLSKRQPDRGNRTLRASILGRNFRALSI